MKEGGITRQYSLEVSVEIMRRSICVALAVLCVILGCTAVLFSRGMILTKLRPEAVKEGYTSTKILAQGGIANDLYDLYSIPSLLMSWCMFWGMSLK